MKNLKWILGILFLCLLTVLGFQNCGDINVVSLGSNNPEPQQLSLYRLVSSVYQENPPLHQLRLHNINSSGSLISTIDIEGDYYQCKNMGDTNQDNIDDVLCVFSTLDSQNSTYSCVITIYSGINLNILRTQNFDFQCQAYDSVLTGFDANNDNSNDFVVNTHLNSSWETIYKVYSGQDLSVIKNLSGTLNVFGNNHFIDDINNDQFPDILACARSTENQSNCTSVQLLDGRTDTLISTLDTVYTSNIVTADTNNDSFKDIVVREFTENSTGTRTYKIISSQTGQTLFTNVFSGVPWAALPSEFIQWQNNTLFMFKAQTSTPFLYFDFNNSTYTSQNLNVCSGECIYINSADDISGDSIREFVTVDRTGEDSQRVLIVDKVTQEILVEAPILIEQVSHRTKFILQDRRE